jgi:hypothetical protein
VTHAGCSSPVGDETTTASPLEHGVTGAAAAVVLTKDAAMDVPRMAAPHKRASV